MYEQARGHPQQSIQVAREIGLEAYEADAQQKLDSIAYLQGNDHTTESDSE